jgi:predicted nucleic acid-binding protein
VRAAHGYKTIDAINLAAAVEASCNIFLTNDAQLTDFRDITVEILP